MRHRKSINEPGHAHELTFSCFHRFQFLSKDRACQWLADAIRKACSNLDYSLWAYVFMPDHAHLIVHPENAVYDVSDFLFEVKHRTSRKALAYLRREAPAWVEKLMVQNGTKTEYHFRQQGGGFDRNITESSTLEKMINYIHMNPVRKGLCVRAEEWKWSSARWFIQLQKHEYLPVTPIPHDWTIGMSND